MRYIRDEKGRPRWSLLFAVGLSVLLLVLAFRGVDTEAMLATVRQGKPEQLMLAFLTLSFTYLMRGLRWWVLLSADRPFSPLIGFWGTSSGYLGNSFLPARAGELIRCVMIERRTGIPLTFSLATALTERLLDALALVLFSVASIPYLTGIPEWLGGAARAFGVMGVIGVAGLLVAPRMQGLILSVIRRLPLPDAPKEKIAGLAEHFLMGMRAFQSVTRALAFLAFMVVIWTGDVIVVQRVAAAFGLVLDLPQGLLLLAALGLASAVPSTPGYVGVYQFVAVTVLVPFGFAQDQALVFILAYQAVTYAVVVIWGFLSLWRLNSGLPTAAESGATIPAAPPSA